MSKPGTNSTPMKQESNPYKKDNRSVNPSPNNQGMNPKDRTSGNFNSPSNQISHGYSGNQHDRSKNDSNKNSSNRGNDQKMDDKDKQASDSSEKKFTGRCRLFVGNLTPDVSENDFRKMFEQYGEVSEVYVNTSRGFGFIRLDYRQNAEAAKAALDGLQRKGRTLRVRFATHGAALKVKNLHPFVSNELLEQSFSQFGDLERCIVIVDDRGKPTGEGIVEFARKPGYNSALRRITEGVFLIGSDPKPIGVEPLEQKDEEDGMPEKFLTKTDQYKKEREKEPRFAPPGTFEYEFGMRWKQLEEVEKQRIEQIKKDTDDARLKLEDEMQTALYDYQAEQIRQDLRRQQEELQRLEELKNNDRMRRQQEMELRRQREEQDRNSQEHRRRTDMMLSMRQHEIASRGRMDGPGMRGRDDMMMAERFGDRMQDRMGDRMGDRVPDRMGDRVGPGQPGGFLWDEKQQREANLRGEGGRGRDMRGSGASPLQPPPGSQAGLERNMDRGGPMERGPMDRGPMERGAAERSVSSAAAAAVAAAAAIVSQGAKANPKPLMQGAGPFAGMGSGPQGMGPNAAQGGPDNAAMEEDSFMDDVHQDNLLDETDLASDLKDTSESNEEEQIVNTANNPFHGQSFECHRSPNSLEENLLQENSEVNAVTLDDSPSELLTQQSLETNLDALHNDFVESASLKIQVSSDNQCASLNLETASCSSPKSPIPLQTTVVSDTLEVDSSISGNRTIVLTPDLNPEPDKHVIDMQCSEESDSPIFDLEKVSMDNSTVGSCSHQDEESCVYTTNNELGGKPVNDDRTRSSGEVHSPTETCQPVESDEQDCHFIHSPIREEAVEKCDSSPDQTSSDHKLATSSCQSLLETNNDVDTVSDIGCIANSQPSSASPDQYVSLSNPDNSCEIVSIKINEMDSGEMYDESIPHIGDCETEEAYSTNCSENSIIPTEAEEGESCTFDQNCTTASTTTSTSTSTDPIIVLNSEPGPKVEQKSSLCSINSQDGALTSYKQRSNDGSEMDIETDDEGMGRSLVSPSIYQSYGEGATNSGFVNGSWNKTVSSYLDIAEYNTCGGESSLWSPVISTPAETNQPDIPSCISSDTHSSVTQDSTVVFENRSSSAGAASISNTFPDRQNAEQDDHQGALCTGDQTFKTAAARQSALVPFMRPTQAALTLSSSSHTPRGAVPVLVQGIPRPAMMSSTVQFAHRLPGGATIMRQQSMSAGLAGSMAAHSTVLQQQGKATAVLQQRSMTAGGQTVLVQQRTMCTGLGTVAQQTVVQQRVAGGSATVTPAMYHASTIQQQALQNRAIRLSNGQVGAPMYRAPTVGGATFIRGGSPAYLRQQQLLQAGSQSQMIQGAMMQQLVRQRYLGGPVMPGRIQMVAGRPIRLKMTCPREVVPVESNK